ncbi:MAG: glycerophosphodiester phosphodiesterase, partial [Limnochordia bacterium]
MCSFFPTEPIVVAHRGAAHYAPENTLAAYRNAVRLGYRYAETDVGLT